MTNRDFRSFWSVELVRAPESEQELLRRLGVAPADGPGMGRVFISNAGGHVYTADRREPRLEPLPRLRSSRNGG